jgi:hypothetical protein
MIDSIPFRRIKYVGILLLLVVPVGIVSAQTDPMTLEEIVAAAPRWSLSVRQAELAVAEARGERDIRYGLDSTELNLSADYLGGDRSRQTIGSRVGVEPVPQVGFSAGVDAIDSEGQDPILERSIATTIAPLAASRPSWRDTRALATAVVLLEDATKEARRDAELRSTAVLVQRRRLAIAEAVLSLRSEEYELQLRRREIGGASFGEVQEAQADMIEARRTVFEAEQQLLQNESDLTRALPLVFDSLPNGAATHDRPPIVVASISQRELDRILDDRRRRVEEIQAAGIPVSTTDLALARTELEAMEAERGQTLVWRPDLTVRGGVTYSSETDTPSPSVGVELTLSPSQVARRERRELDQRLALKRLEIASLVEQAKLAQYLVERNIELVQESLAVAKAQYQRDLRSLEEGTLLVARGVITPLERRQLEINVASAEVAVFRASIDLYTTLGEYLDLYR